MDKNQLVSTEAANTESVSYESVNQSLSVIDNISTGLSYATDIVNVASNAATQWKEMDVQIAQMDRQLAAYLATLSVDFKKYKERLPIVREQLNGISNRMDKILDKVLLMETQTDNEADVKLKLLEMLDNYTDKLSTMMVKLL